MSVASVSVIIPYYQAKATILRAVHSVYRQTLRPVEVIIVDDFSNDGSLEYLHKIKASYPVGWVSIVSLQKNSGPGSARNRGWEIATQDYVAFLDSDDSWHPRKIEIQYLWMKNNLRADLTAHSYQIAEIADVSFGELPDVIGFRKVSRILMLASNRLPTRSVMLKRKIDIRFKEGKNYSEDYQLWLEIIFSGYCCYKSPAPMACSYKADYGHSGLSASLWKMEKGELESYKNLYKKKMIGAFVYKFLCLFSLCKFLRRIVVVQLFKFRKR